MKIGIGMVGVLLGLAGPVMAAEVVVTHAMARASAPGQDSGMVDLHVLSQRAGQLVHLRCSAAQRVEIHQMSYEQGVMRMRPVDALALPAKQEVDLARSGYHLMLLGLSKPLRAGTTVPLSLTVRYADQHEETVEASIEVMPLTATHAHHHE